MTHYTHQQEKLLQDRWDSLTEDRKHNIHLLSTDKRKLYEKCVIIGESKEYEKALMGSIHMERNDLSVLKCGYQIAELSGRGDMLEGGLERGLRALKKKHKQISDKEFKWDCLAHRGY